VRYTNLFMSLVLCGNIMGHSFLDEGATILSPSNCCKILEKHVKTLVDFHEFNNKKGLIILGSSVGLPFFLENYDYTNEVIRACIDNIVKKASLEPLFKTWAFSDYLDINKNDTTFLREFSILLFSLYENLLVTLTIHRSERDAIKGTLNEIIELYNTVSNMPIKELLVTLEKCYVIFAGIMNDYGMYSNIGWDNWLKRYWWVAPTVVLAVLGILLKRTSRPGYFNRPIRV